MKAKMLWRKMTVGMAIALMLAMSLGTLATAAEMIGEDMIATQAEDTIWEDEIDLSGDETVLESAEENIPSAEEDIPEEIVQAEEAIPSETTDDETDEELIEDAGAGIEEEIFTEDAEELAAGTGYIEFTTAEEISADAMISMKTDEEGWFKFVAPKSAYYQCDISFNLPGGARYGAVDVTYYNSDGMELKFACVRLGDVEKEDEGYYNKVYGYIYLNSQETIYLRAFGWAVEAVYNSEIGGRLDVPGNFSFVVNEAVDIQPEDAQLDENENYLRVWCYNGDDVMDVCLNASVTLVAGWATYGNKQPVFKWESVPQKWGTVVDGEEEHEDWTDDESKPSAVLSSTTNQVTVNAPSVAGEAIKVYFTATINDIEKDDWFLIKSSADSHQPGDWVQTAAPTALAEGTRVRTCKLCGQVTASEQIPKLPAFIHMNVAANSTIPLKVRQTTTKIKVTGLQTGDRVTAWTSSKPQIATVDASGKIQGKKKGTAVITVTTASGLTYSFKIKVQKSKVAAKKIIIESPKKLTLKKKAKAKIGAQLLPITTLDKISYATSDKKIATVSKGVITARNKGKATIFVKAGKKTVKINVKVTK